MNDKNKVEPQAEPAPTPVSAPVAIPSLAKLIPADNGASRRTTVDYRGLRFVVSYLPAQQIEMMGRQCLYLAADPDNPKRRTQRLDPERFGKLLVAAILRDWQGVTLRSLQTIMILNTDGLSPEQLDAEIPFSPDQAESVLQHANGLMEFLQTVATDASNFRLMTPELEKNS